MRPTDPPLRYCRNPNCGGFLPDDAGRNKYCTPACREETRKLAQGSLQTRHQKLIRILEAERTPSTDPLYSFEFYAALLADNRCTYCDGPLSPTGIGLDRVDSDLPHIASNVVPCDQLCNGVKSGVKGLTYAEMLLIRPGLIEISKLRQQQTGLRNLVQRRVKRRIHIR